MIKKFPEKVFQECVIAERHNLTAELRDICLRLPGSNPLPKLQFQAQIAVLFFYDLELKKSPPLRALFVQTYRFM